MRTTRARHPRAPVKKHAASNPSIVAEGTLPQIHPVVAVAVLPNFNGITKRGILPRLIHLVDPIRAARASSVNHRIRNPSQQVLVARVKLQVARAGRAHGVEVVAILDMRAVADHRYAARVPIIRVPETEVVSVLVTRNTHAGARFQPAALPAHVRLSSKRSRRTRVNDRVEIKVRRIKSRSFRGSARIGQNFERIAIGIHVLVPRLGSREDQDGRHGCDEAQPSVT